MKKTRTLAALLCIILVVCSLPMLTFAEISSGLYNTIGALMESTSTIPVEDDPAYGGMKFDFTDNFSHTADMATYDVSGNAVDFDEVGFSYNSPNALNFPNTISYTWRYYPSAFPKGWSPLTLGAYTFRFQLDEGGALEAQSSAYGTNNRSYVSFSQTGVTVYEDDPNQTENKYFLVTQNTNPYIPGTDWNDVVIIANGGATNSSNGYSVYMKKASDATFTLVASAASYRQGGAWKSTGMTFTGHDAHVSDAVMLKSIERASSGDSIEEIMGTPVSTAYDFELSNGFATVMTPDAAATPPMGVVQTGTYTKEGWSGTSWSFLGAAGVNWSPLKSGGVETAVAFTAKVTSDGMIVEGHSPLSNGRIYFVIKAGSVPESNATQTFTTTLTPDTNPADYLITQYNNGNGYALYMKSDSVTGGKWELMVATNDYQSSNNGNRGLVFSDNGDCIIKNVKIYSTNAVADDNALPANETELMYGENFNVEPAYSNLECNGATYDGDLVLTETSDAEAQAVLYNAAIPVGGYAEYRIKAGETTPTVGFYDGTTGIEIYHRVGYGVIYDNTKGINQWSGNGNTTYRTFRVVRNGENTYSVYCKSDGDTVWYKAAENVTGKSTAEAPQVKISGTKSYAGDNGVAEIDYLKIYGPQTERVVTLTDGAGTTIVNEVAQPTYLDSISAAVKPDTGKDRLLIFGVYGENNTLIDVIAEEIKAGTEPEIVLCNPIGKGLGVKKVRVFLWDSLGGMIPVTGSSAIKGNVVSWEDDWNLGGQAMVDGDALVLDTESGAESYAECKTNLGSQFDISWNMTIDTYSGHENIQIDNGSYRSHLSVAKDGITYNTASGTETLPWIINHGEHTFRVIGNGGSTFLYIDGYFVGELSDLETCTEEAKIKFWNQDDSDMRISNISFETYRESNIPAQGFLDEFENGDTCGWSTPATSFTVPERNADNSIKKDTNGDTLFTTLTEQWVYSTDGCLTVEDWHMAYDNNTCTTSSEKTIAEPGDDFVFQSKILFPKKSETATGFGTESLLQIYLGERYLNLDIREKFFAVTTPQGQTSSSDQLAIVTDQYYVLTIESYHCMKNARIYLDGILIQDAEMAETSKSNSYYGTYGIRFYANGGWYEPAIMQMDYVKYAPKYYDITLSAPSGNASYQVGDTVYLAASENVEFMLNGNVVASGTSASLTDLPEGSYELVAKSGNKASEAILFTVEDIASATLQASQSGTTISASLDDISGFSSVASVAYLLDGQKKDAVTTSPYSTSISDVTAENHVLEAVAYNAAGIEIARFLKEMPAVVSDATVAYSNEITYIASSTGVAEVKNGNHKLSMSHSASGVSYETDEGTKTYRFGTGTGTFKILTDGPIAEVYRNGQYVFGFRMPRTTEIGTSFTGNLTAGSVAVPAERKNWFSARNLNVQNAVYELADLPHNHNLDFVASPDNEVHLALNDGYYRNDVTLKDGKIYLWTAERNNSVPELTEVMTMASGDVYYRVETSGGMSRLYADGKWVYTFRNGNVAGRKGTLAVNVTGGDGLSYLGVNSNADLYFYEDTFDVSDNEFASSDYWRTSGANSLTFNGSVTLDATGKTNAMAELNAYVGNASLSAEVTASSHTSGGVWFISNHGVTNTYTKTGYNFADKRYEIVNVVEGTETILQKQPGDFAGNLTMKLEETEEGRTVALYSGDTKRISASGVVDSRGTIGFVITNNKVSVDNVMFRGDAKPMLDVRDNPLDGEKTLDMIETPEKTYLVNGNGGFTTTDGGMTWESFTPTKGNGLSSKTGYAGGMTENMVTLKNGEILSIYKNVPMVNWDKYGQRQVVHQVYYSNSKGLEWDKITNLNDSPTMEVGRGATVNRITQGPSGRVYFVSGEGNSEDYGDVVVWMSDNNGGSWFKSMTEISALNEDYVIAEAVVVEIDKGDGIYETRLYFRTDKGQLCYYQSYDRGLNWVKTPHATPFISSMTCFAIEADPGDETGNTLYLAWGYDNINLYARAQYPRTRWAVAKSTDGGDTWEMIGTAHENNSINIQNMNLNINVGEEYIYLNGFSSDTYAKTTMALYRSRIVSFPKSKQRTSPRMEQLHMMEPTQIENTVVLPEGQEEMAMAVHSASGGVILHGQWIPDAADGEYVALEVAAAFVGATLTAKENQFATLELGNTSVTFGDGSMKTVEDKQFVKLSTFAAKFSMSVTEEDGSKIISRNSNWSQRQRNALRYATDLFSEQP